MHRDEIKEKVDWTLAYEDDLDWAAPHWEDPLEERAMAVLQHEAEKQCKTEVLENRKCLEVAHNLCDVFLSFCSGKTCSTFATRPTMPPWLVSTSSA